MRSHAAWVTAILCCLYGPIEFVDAGDCPLQLHADLHCYTGISSGDYVFTSIQFDDGSGDAVYFGGSFSSAEAVWPLNNIMRWDGTSATPVGGGFNGVVRAFAVYDDGTGPALYAGGSFSTAGGSLANGLAKWDGVHWTAVGNFVGDVRALKVFDSGTGPYLYVAGQFATLPGMSSPNIVRWDGEVFSPLANGTTAMVKCLEIHDAGTGEMLYAGGTFTGASGIAALRVARWTGSSWQSVGAGFNNNVEALCSFDLGSGPQLYAGGGFTGSGALGVSRIARLQGNSWVSVGIGMNNEVNGLAGFEDDQGPSLFATGSFNLAGGISAPHVARWNGQSWTPVGMGLSTVAYKLLPVSLSGTSELYASGSFLSTSGNLGALQRIARWDGSHWRALGGKGLALSAAFKLMQKDWGEGPRLVAIGSFENAGSLPSRSIGQWDGDDWRWMGGGAASPGFDAVEVFENRLVVAGQVMNIGGIPVNRIAQWNGTSWSALGNGLTGGAPSALAILPTENGSLLIACGTFTQAGSTAVKRIAQWDGEQWSGLNGQNTGPDSGQVTSMVVFDDGTGTALYVGGEFTAIDGNTTLKFLAKWNGKQWSPIGNGLNAGVTKLQVLDDGSGPSLYARGWFTTAGGQPAKGVARWTGSSWDPLGGGVSGGSGEQISDMIMFDNCSGPSLYVTGNFMAAGGQPAERIARWDGQSWKKLGLIGLSDDGKSLAVFDDGTGPALYVTGSFLEAGGLAAHRLAKWNGSSWSVVGTGLGPIPGSSQVFGDTLATLDTDQGTMLCVSGNFASLAGEIATRFGVIHACEATAPPSSFTLISPIDVSGQLLNPQFTWTAADGLFVRYKFELASDSEFAKLVYSKDSLVGLSIVLPGELLAFDTPYYWRVTASNALGVSNAVPTVAQFTTMKNPDVTGNGLVDVDDLLVLINGWGQCGVPAECSSDLNNDGVIDVDDLLLLLNHWG